MWFSPLFQESPFDLLSVAFVGGVIVFISFLIESRFLATVGATGLLLSLIGGAHFYAAFIKDHAIIKLTILLGGLTLIFSFLYFAIKLRPVGGQFFSWLTQAIGLCALFLPFLWLRMYIIFLTHYYYIFTAARSSLSGFFEYIIRGKAALVGHDQLAESALYRDYAFSFYYGVISLLLILGGYAYEKPLVRYSGLALLGLALFECWKIFN